MLTGPFGVPQMPRVHRALGRRHGVPQQPVLGHPRTTVWRSQRCHCRQEQAAGSTPRPGAAPSFGDPQCIVGVQELPGAAPLLGIGQSNRCSAAGELPCV